MRAMKVLFECDQCAYQEWREEQQEPWPCVVCGWVRWQIVAREQEDESAESPSPPEPDRS